MAVITLTTDWQTEDFYVGAVKGELIKQCPAVNIVDITHRINIFNTTEAAFVIRSAYKRFPEGTIHIIGVNSDNRMHHNFLVVKHRNHYFIGADNGIFSLIIDEKPEQIIEINQDAISEPFLSFPELTVFTHVAAGIANNVSPENYGHVIQNVRHTPEMMANIESSRITGKVIYIDSYKNVITNISKTIFEQVGKGRAFDIFVQSRHNRISHLNSTYSESREGEMLALFNSADLLEIALKHGKLAEMYSLDKSAAIRVDFYTKQE